MQNAGSEFPLDQNAEILKIDSPQKMVKGPWLVVHKDIDQRWAIVLLHWDESPCLGIRWFYGGQGTPSVRQYATWLIIPEELTDAVLDKLPLSPQKRQTIYQVLLGERTLDELLFEKEKMHNEEFTGINIYN